MPGCQLIINTFGTKTRQVLRQNSMISQFSDFIDAKNEVTQISTETNGLSSCAKISQSTGQMIHKNREVTLEIV